MPSIVVLGARNREDGVHVALLVVDATIDAPKTAAMIEGKAANSGRRPGADRPGRRVPRGADAARHTHELVVTPAGDRWLP